MGNFRQNTKSSFGREGFISHSTRSGPTENRHYGCAIKPCTECLFMARMLNVLLHVAVLLHNLLIISIILIVCLLFVFRKCPQCADSYRKIVIRIQRDGLLVTRTPKVCYDCCNYVNSNIVMLCTSKCSYSTFFLYYNNK